MKTRSQRWLGAVGAGVVLAAVAFAAILEFTMESRSKGPPERMRPEWVSEGSFAFMTITVTEPDGSTRSARLECGDDNQGTGYLARKASAAFACETAIVNPTVNDYLVGEDVRGASCTKTFNPPPPAYVVRFEGYMPERTSRTLDVARDPCGEALAVLMFPLLESTAEGPSLGGL